MHIAHKTQNLQGMFQVICCKRKSSQNIQEEHRQKLCDVKKKFNFFDILRKSTYIKLDDINQF